MAPLLGAFLFASPAGALSAGDIVALGSASSPFDPTGVYHVDPDAGTAQLLGTLPSAGLTRVAVEPRGTVLVAGSAGVERLDPQTGTFTTLSNESVSWVDVTANGRIFVTAGGTLYELHAATGVRMPVFSSTQALIGLAAAVPGTLLTARNIPVDDPDRPDVLADRELLSIDVTNGTMSVVSVIPSVRILFDDSTWTRTTLDVQATPASEVFTSLRDSGFVNGGSISSTSPDTPSYGWSGPSGSGPSAFVIDDQGRLLIAQSSAGLTRVTRVGGSNVTEVLDPSPPLLFGDLALTPIPEPGTSALLALGLLLAGTRPAITLVCQSAARSATSRNPLQPRAVR